jgi:hypothetical protein
MTTPEERMQDLGFTHPYNVGSSEYRAIWDTVSEALESDDTDEQPDSVIAFGVLAEFSSWARDLSARLVL